MKFVIEEPLVERMWILDEDISEQKAHGLKLMFDTYFDMKDLKMFRTSIKKNFDNSSLYYFLHKEFIDGIRERLKYMMQ